MGRVLQGHRDGQCGEVGMGGKAPTAIWHCCVWYHSLPKAILPNTHSLCLCHVTRLQTLGNGVPRIRQVGSGQSQGPRK